MLTYLNNNSDGMLMKACAGLLNADNPEDCIRKETEEETGYQINEVEVVFEIYMSLGSVTEILYFFVTKYSKEQQINDGRGVKDEEEIEVLELDFNVSLKMIKSGEIKDAKTIMLLQYAQINNLINI